LFVPRVRHNLGFAVRALGLPCDFQGNALDSVESDSVLDLLWLVPSD
jgi:hypothetical protein